MINFIKNSRNKLILAGIILITGVIFIIYLFNAGSVKQNNQEPNLIKSVQVFEIIKENNNFINIIGEVKPISQIDVISLAKGTVQNINFEIGDFIDFNQNLANLYNNQAFINLNNANLYYSNSSNNFNAIYNLTQEAIKQAELNLQNMQENLSFAEINLQTTQSKTSLDLQNLQNQIPDVLNTAYNNSYYSINTLIDPMFSQDKTTSPKLTFLTADSQAQIDSEWQRQLAGNALDKILESASLNNAEEQIIIIRDFLNKLNQALNYSINLTTDILNIYKSNINLALTNANRDISSIKFLDQAINSQEIINKNNLDIANAQLTSARIALDNAKASLESSKQSQSQQINSAQIALDNAKSQLDLALSQVDDLEIKAGISGQITGKFIELGQEINPGQKIAQISQADALKIQASINPEYASQVFLGQETSAGIISLINPVADQITKKINLEILPPIQDSNLVPGTFVNINIPIKNQDIILIPLNAVYITQNNNFVFLNKNNIAKKQEVILGEIQNDFVEILSGLDFGDQIILNKNIQDKEVILWDGKKK